MGRYKLERQVWSGAVEHDDMTCGRVRRRGEQERASLASTTALAHWTRCWRRERR